VLTPRDETDVVVLYELVPVDVADGRQTRFDRKQIHETVTTESVSDAIVGGDAPSDITGGDGSVAYQWGDWCAVNVTQLSTSKVSQVSGLVEDVLRDAGIDESGVVSGFGESVCLPEAAGVRLTLLFTGIKRVRKNDKIRHIRDGIARMSLGECYYWHSKIKSPEEPNGTTALRELLTGHLN
jgi:hypothetical protein